MTKIVAFCASAVVLLMGCQAAKARQEKPVVMRYFPTSNEAVYDRWDGTVIYGEPREILLILSRTHMFCSQPAGTGIQGLPSTRDVSLIQIDDYALVEGVCGNPSLHLVLIKRGPQVLTWLVDGCTWRRNAQATPLREILASKNGCWIPDETVSRMLLVRSGVVPAYCRQSPQSDVLCPRFRYDAADTRFIHMLRRLQNHG